MLLIDGVKYEEWVPQGPQAEDEFERVVKEHTQDIFGEQSIYLNIKQKLKSVSGIGSIPDGFAIIFGDLPQWHIVEVELSSHPLDDHIASQVRRFITGANNWNTQQEIAKTIYEEVVKDSFLKLKVEQAIKTPEVYKFLAELISKQAILTIIIEKDTQELREVLSTIRYPQEIKVVEFQTFKRVGAEAVHAHLFEPLYVTPPPPPPPKEFLNELRQGLINKRPELKPSEPTDNYCYIPLEHERIHVEWLFLGKQELGVELHLERATKAENLRLFKRLEAEKAKLGRSIGETLEFKPWGKKRFRVYALGEIKETPEFKQWAVETMIKFYDVFKPLLDEIDI